MIPTLAILLLWAGFIGTHMGLSSLALRKRLVARVGEQPFRGLYSLVSFAFFVPLVWVYLTHTHAGPRLWTVPVGPGLRWTIYVLMGVAFVMVVAGFARPSPASIVPGDARPRGIQRVTRHPVFMGLGLFGLVHLIPNGSTADVAFFAGFPLFAVLGCRHQDTRKLTAGTPGYRTFHAETPFLPFTGRDTVRGLRELSPIVVAIGILATVVVRYFHPVWFGG